MAALAVSLPLAVAAGWAALEGSGGKIIPGRA